MRVTAGDRMWMVPPFRSIWIPAGAAHEVRMIGAVCLRTLYFQAEIDVLGGVCSVVNVSDLMRELIVHVCNEGIVSDDADEHRAVIDLLLSLARKMSTVPLSIPMPLDPRAMAMATEIIADPGSEPGELARRHDVGLRTIQRIFSDETGLSLGRWRRQARLLVAMTLLEEGRSVTDAALDVGFESVSAFINSFRNQFGTTPAKYGRSGRDSDRT